MNDRDKPTSSVQGFRMPAELEQVYPEPANKFGSRPNNETITGYSKSLGSRLAFKVSQSMEDTLQTIDEILLKHKSKDSMSKEDVAQFRRLYSFLRDDTLTALLEPSAMSIRQRTVEFLLEMPAVSCLEDDLWIFVYKWAQHQVGVTTDLVPMWTAQQRKSISQLVAKLVVPGRLRILDVSIPVFVNEIEPFGFLDEEEMLFKYRYEALRPNYERDQIEAFLEQHYLEPPNTLDDILLRVRARCKVLESSHPHEIDAFEEEEIAMPFWATHTLIQFDTNTLLAPGAEIGFYASSDFIKENKIASFLSFAVPGSIKYLVLNTNYFWMNFTSRGSKFGTKWGYKFRCVPMRLKVSE